jgi:hypothetical protein
MNPYVVLLEGIIEALVYIRRALAVVRYTSDALDVTQEIVETFNKRIRYKETVVGEEAYLFILGFETIKKMQLCPLLDDVGKAELTAAAVVELKSQHHSSDAATVSLLFAETLGRMAQRIDPSTHSLINAYLNREGAKYTSSDPVFTRLLKKDNSLPAGLADFIVAMGLPLYEWGALVSYSQGRINSSTWADKVYGPPGKARRIYHEHTFEGAMLRGADSVRLKTAGAISFTLGSDSLRMSTVGLCRPGVTTMRREFLDSSVYITLEMSRLQSEAVMISRGYIKTTNGDYVKAEQARARRVKDDTNKETIIIEVDRDSFDPSKMIDRLTSRIVNKSIEALLSRGASKPATYPSPKNTKTP